MFSARTDRKYNNILIKCICLYLFAFTLLNVLLHNTCNYVLILAMNLMNVGLSKSIHINAFKI